MRWALTPPFHPYLRFPEGGCFLWHCPSDLAIRPGVTWRLVHRSPDFPRSGLNQGPDRDRPVNSTTSPLNITQKGEKSDGAEHSAARMSVPTRAALTRV